MRKFLWVFMCALASVSLFAAHGRAPADTVDLRHYTILSINDITMWCFPNGTSSKVDGYFQRYPVLTNKSTYTRAGGIFYGEDRVPIVHSDGLLFGGFIHSGGDSALHVSGSRYLSAMQPGTIISPGTPEQADEQHRTIWNIRRDWDSADLMEEAGVLFNLPATIKNPPPYPDTSFSVEVRDVNIVHINAVRDMYRTSRETWPWQKGAPFYDDNNNGVMDEDEEPGLLNADQVVWYVCNDLDENKCLKFLGSPPMGMELQVTLWAYNRKGSGILGRALNQTVFRHYRLIYKGDANVSDSAVIDSMFISLMADIDIGNPLNDFVGCDTLLNMMYGYNGRIIDEEIDCGGPPCVGYSLLAGPMNNAGYRNKLMHQNVDNIFENYYRNITSFNYFTLGAGFWYDLFAGNWYNTMNGLNPWGGPFPDASNNPDSFPLSDDPSKGGDVDGIMLCPYERIMQMHSGPFSMALGDTLDVVIAVVGSMGSDNIASVSVMKYWAKWARYFFRYGMWNSLAPFGRQKDVPDSPVPGRFALFQNFPNPFNAETSIRYDIPEKSTVVIRVFNSLGREVAVLVNEKKEPGAYTAQWDASGMPSGVYVYKMQAGAVVRAGKMVVMK